MAADAELPSQPSRAVVNRRPASALAPCSSPAVAVIVAVGLAFSLPVALWGFRPGDPMHLPWAQHFAEQLWSGDLYPRWLMGMNSGLGSPTFFYYGCVPYYITSLFEAAVPYRDYGWPALGLSASLALVASGFTAWLWLRETVPPQPAMLGAVVYMLAPYHLKVDYLERFAFAEFWAFVWIPLLLLYAHRCSGGERRAVVPLAVSYALLAMTHAPSTLLFSAVPILYAAVLSEPGRRLAGSARVAAGLLLGGLLAAIYLVPALTMQAAASISEMKQGFAYYANNFLFTGARPFLPGMSENFVNYHMSVRAAMGVTTALTVATVLTSFLAGALLLRAAPGAAPTHLGYRRAAQFWAGLVAVALLMMTTSSRPLWDRLPMLQMVQFPWRFNILLVCAATASVTLASAALMDYVRRWRAGSPGASGLTLSLSLLLLIVPAVVMAVEIFDTAKLINATRFAERTIPEPLRYRDYREYRPHDVSPSVFTPEMVRQLGATLPRAAVREGTGSVQVVSWRPRRIVLAVNATSDARVVVKQFYFRGWHARSSSGAQAFPVTASQPESLVMIAVPPGQHNVELSLDAEVPERAGAALSALALLGVSVLTVRYRKARPLPS